MNSEMTVNVSEIPEEHSPKTKADKRLEKLSVLKEKYEKAAAAQAAAEKKTESLNAQIIKIRNEIHAEEAAVLDRICSEKNLSYKDIADIIGSIPDNMTTEEIKRLFL